MKILTYPTDLKFLKEKEVYFIISDLFITYSDDDKEYRIDEHSLLGIKFNSLKEIYDSIIKTCEIDSYNLQETFSPFEGFAFTWKRQVIIEDFNYTMTYKAVVKKVTLEFLSVEDIQK